MTIGELAEQAGVTPRTVRYYVAEGLLPAPEYGRPAEYTDEHLRRLDLIRRLKDQYLPLEEIRDMVQRLSLEEVEALARQPGLAAPARLAEPGPLSSAADYIAQVLGRGAARAHLKQQAPGAPAPAPASAPLVPAGPTAVVPWTPTAPPMWAPPAVPPHAPQAPAPAQTPPAWPAPAPSPETWQRVALAPGVELHYIAGQDTGRQHIVARLISAARHILASNPEKEREEP